MATFLTNNEGKFLIDESGKFIIVEEFDKLFAGVRKRFMVLSRTITFKTLSRTITFKALS